MTRIPTKSAEVLLDRLELGPIDTNCYMITNVKEKQMAVVDPGGSYPKLKSYLAELQQETGAKVTMILNTHGHWDHIGAEAALKRDTGAKIWIHAADAPLLSQSVAAGFGVQIEPCQADESLTDEETLWLGSVPILVLATPGHTPGGVSLVVNQEFVLSGDTLFQYSIGRTDFAGGDFAAILHSIKTKLYQLPDEMPVYPGHGPATTIGAEKRSNPFTRE